MRGPKGATTQPEQGEEGEGGEGGRDWHVVVSWGHGQEACPGHTVKLVSSSPLLLASILPCRSKPLLPISPNPLPRPFPWVLLRLAGHKRPTM